MAVSVYALILVVIVIAASFRRTEDGGTVVPFIDWEGTVQLKGVAILLVIISHLKLLKFISLPYDFSFSGAWGVAIFLFLSGFGLTQSYLKNGVGHGFFKKRLGKVVLPYVIVTGIWLAIDAIFLAKTYSWSTAILALIGFDSSTSIDPTMWFVTFIILWYLIFFLVFKLPTRDVVKLGLLFVFAYLFRNHAALVFPSRISWQLGLHAYLFPVGALAGLYYRRLSYMAKPKVLVLCLSVAAIPAFYFFSVYVGKSLVTFESYTWANFAFALGAILLMATARFYGLSSKLLVLIGSISYELYLFEWVFMGKYNLLYAFNSKWLSGLLFTLVIVALSISLRRFKTIVVNWCCKTTSDPLIGTQVGQELLLLHKK
ncbi:MAG: acyltransferase family protein [Candidatus Aquicultor sp.]